MSGEVTSPEQRSSPYPDQPGVYLMRDAQGSVIYVGKAKSLKKRVSSYFTGTKDIKTRTLVRNVRDVEVIVTGSEQEALLLENTLIKRWKPRYNIRLTDGKTYPVIKVSNEEYPRVYRTRRIAFDGSSYFGPYPRAHVIDAYLELVNRLFPLRKCRGPLKRRERPCLNWHIGRCSGPCAGKTTREEYLERVEHVRKLLAGRTEDLVRELRAAMQQASAARRYERAALYRDQIQAVLEISESQKVVDFTAEDRDYVGWAMRGEEYSFTVLQVRQGKLVGKELFDLTGSADPQEVLEQFLERYYTQLESRPPVVYVPEAVDSGRLDSSLGIRLRRPQRGKHARTVSLASENAREALDRRLSRAGAGRVVEELGAALGLARPPSRIEGFDISHLGGEHTVGSLVTFVDGSPWKGGYRTFKLRHLAGRVDDYDALREVVSRRYSRVLAEELPLPDLLLVDGGRGQVAAVASILAALGLEEVPLAGLAKEEEAVWLRGAAEPLVLPRTSEALRLLIAVRDESHRFANVLRRRLAARKMETSVYEGIPGIGKARARRLLEAFGPPEGLKGRTPEEVARATGLTTEMATTVLAQLADRREPPRSTGTATGAGPAAPTGAT